MASRPLVAFAVRRKRLQIVSQIALTAVTLTLFALCWHQRGDIARLRTERDTALARLNDLQKSPAPDIAELNNCLIAAAAHGNIKQAEWLLRQGANINGEGQEYGYGSGAYTPLIAAVFYDHAPMVEFLLAHGADVNYAVSSYEARGQTALLCVAGREKETMLRLLIRHGASVSTKNSEGESAIAEAITYHALPDVKILLEQGASVRDQSAQRAMKFLVIPYDAGPNEQRTALLKLLLAHGADPNGRDGSEGDPTLLISACGGAYGHDVAPTINLVAVRILLDAGANPNLRDRYGKSARDYARACAVDDRDQRRDSRIVLQLLEKAGAR